MILAVFIALLPRMRRSVDMAGPKAQQRATRAMMIYLAVGRDRTRLLDRGGRLPRWLVRPVMPLRGHQVMPDETPSMDKALAVVHRDLARGTNR